jgi:hypothetical protein
MDLGSSQIISPDLTTNNPEKQKQNEVVDSPSTPPDENHSSWWLLQARLMKVIWSGRTMNVQLTMEGNPSNQSQ